jgi:hypothetical protein
MVRVGAMSKAERPARGKEPAKSDELLDSDGTEQLLDRHGSKLVKLEVAELQLSSVAGEPSMYVMRRNPRR